MKEDRYLVGRLKDYHEIFENENVNNNANNLSEQAKLISGEFSNIKNIIVSWSGKGANTVKENKIPSIINKLDTIKTNIDNSLVPATKAIENLKKDLKLMKEKEQELKVKEQDLAKESARNVSPKIYKGENRKGEGIYVDNPKYAEWLKKIEDLKNEIQKLTNELNSLKNNCENYIKTVEQLEDSIINFSLVLETATATSNDTSLNYVIDKLPNNRILTEEEKNFMTEEEKMTLNKLCEDEDPKKAIEYMRKLDEVIEARIYNTPIEERGLTPTEQKFINDNINDNGKLRLLIKGEEVLDGGKITLREGETIEVLVKIPTNEGEHIELCRTGLGRSKDSENKILQSNNLKPDRYDKNEALKETGYYVWTITAKEKGNGYHLTQTTQFNTEKQQYYNSTKGNGAFKEMLSLYIDVV